MPADPDELSATSPIPCLSCRLPHFPPWWQWTKPLNQPQLNVFVYKSCHDHDVSAQKPQLRQVLTIFEVLQVKFKAFQARQGLYLRVLPLAIKHWLSILLVFSNIPVPCCIHLHKTFPLISVFQHLLKEMLRLSIILFLPPKLKVLFSFSEVYKPKLLFKRFLI